MNFRGSYCLFYSRNKLFCDTYDSESHPDKVLEYRGELTYEEKEQIFENRLKRLISVKNSAHESLKELGGVKTKEKSYFMTVGFDIDKITIEKQKELSKKIFDRDWLNALAAVNEKHRADGIHYHCHFVISTEIPKSRIIDRIYEVVKKYVRTGSDGDSKSSVDVKAINNDVDLQQKINYCNGIKKKAKMAYVELDRLWRAENKFEF